MAEVLEGGLLVSSGHSPRRHYELAHLTFEGGESGSFSINLVPIGIIEGQLLVAVPRLVWSKAVADRVLPRSALSRAVLIEVLAADVESPEEPLEEHPGLKVWVGFLQQKLKNRLVLGGAESPAYDVCLEDDVFSTEGITVMPYGPALAKLADEHFSFISAQSGEVAEELGLEERMARLEDTFGGIREQLQVLVGGVRQSAQAVGARAKAAPARAGPLAPRGGELGGLDRGVVASARQAGISEAQLIAIGKLMKKDTKLHDLPQERTKRNALSETEDEEEEPEDGEAQEEQGVAPVEKAILQLTKIVTNISKKKKSNGIEALLDVAEGGGESSSTGGGSRSKAAAYKKLKASLVENPRYIFETVEDLMDQDFALFKSGPGLSSVETSSRAWLEHRSRLQNFPNTVRLAWQIGAVHDCLRQGLVEQARARTCLLLCALDQAALDSGAWTLAQEVLLEPAAPFAAFASRKLPDQWEQATSKILEDRWVDVLMWRIRDRDSYIEARKRLTSSRSSNNPKGDFPPKDPPKDPNPKRQPKPGKGAKGEGKGEGKAASAADSAQA